MKFDQILDRIELLHTSDSSITDLRRACIDHDVNSVFRLLEKLSGSQIVSALKHVWNSDNFNSDCLSRGQIKSKMWLVDQLKSLDVDLGTVFMCGGWYATLAVMLFENNIKLDKIRSFDIDESCWSIAELFNKPWVMKDWQFKACTQNIHDINYESHTYSVTRSDGSVCELTDTPNTIINTSTEHIENFNEWYDKIPSDKLLVFQNNNWQQGNGHINCVDSIEQFGDITPMNTVLFAGSLALEKYTRFMRIGYK
jgi:hypothetical protein